MKKYAIIFLTICLAAGLMFAGCGKTAAQTEEKSSQEESAAAASGEDYETPDEEEEQDSKTEKLSKKKKKNKAKDKEAEKSLAARMAGKYSCHVTDKNGDEELFTMDVVNFGDNLFASCDRSMLDDGEIFDVYSFWAAEFIPYDADEMRSTDGDTVRVNRLCFSIMSNAGKYWDSGHTGTITLTDEGLVFEGFGQDGFLVPDDGDSRLFTKDENCDDAFNYLKDGKGDDDLQGYWVCRDGDFDLYMRFVGPNLYMYQKSQDAEAFFAAGGCDFRSGTFDCVGSCIENGGMPFEFGADYKVDGDRLDISIKGDDAPSQMPAKAEFERISEHDVHVTVMDEIVFSSLFPRFTQPPAGGCS